MPVIFEAMPLGPPRRERQHGIEAIERLNGGFLIDGKDRGVVRRIDVQANHVGGLRLEVGIVRLHVPFEPVRLKAGALPGFRHEVVMNREHAPQFAGIPVRAAVRRRLLRLCQDARFHGRRQDRRRLTTIPWPQPVQPIGQEAAAPPIGVVAIARDRRFNSRVPVTAIRPPGVRPARARPTRAALTRSAEVDARRINVVIADGNVILSGNVHSVSERDEARRAAWAAPGVTNVDDRIAVMP